MSGSDRERHGSGVSTASDQPFIDGGQFEAVKTVQAKLGRMKICVVLLFVLLIALSVVNVFLFLKQREISRDQQKTQKISTNTSDQPASQPEVQARVGAPYIAEQKQEEVILALGDGYRVSKVKAGKALSHWKTSFKYGGCSLESMQYIIVNTTGIYRVYAQVTFYGQKSNTPLDFKVMKNRYIITKAALDGCNFMCSKSVTVLVKLKKGDYLSIISSHDASFFMSPKTSYFGASRIS